HRNFKINETQDTEVGLIDLIDGLNTITYTNEAMFPQYERPKEHQYDLTDEPLTQETYFKMMQDFIKQGDVILAEQGTSFFGAYDLALYSDNKFIGQPLWGSIGYTLPATLGTQMADHHRRNVLLIGDGSLQLTVQEMSSMIRAQMKPVIFVINNDVYTVERKIHGENALYNDIHMWDYKLLPTLFGGENEVVVHDVTTSNTLQHTLLEINDKPDMMHLVEVKMGVHDAPHKLNAIGQAFAKQNG